MPREAYQSTLADLRADVAALGRDAADQFRRAVDALDRDRVDLAREVLADEDAVDERALALESECVRLLALESPVASDLRLVAATFKLLADVRRVGDLATNLAGYAVDAERAVLPEVDLRSLGEYALTQFEDAVDAYATGDPAACRAVAERDDNLDAMVAAAGDAVVRDLVTADAVTTDADVERVLADVRRVVLTLRDVERVGDHAVNVAARTLYAIESDDSLV
jgi:phosphate transport system protein